MKPGILERARMWFCKNLILFTLWATNGNVLRVLGDDQTLVVDGHHWRNRKPSLLPQSVNFPAGERILCLGKEADDGSEPAPAEIDAQELYT